MRHTTNQRFINELSKYKRQCTCGHVIAITNQYKKVVCNWCGKTVYLYEEDKKRNDFKEEMRRLLNGKRIY